MCEQSNHALPVLTHSQAEGINQVDEQRSGVKSQLTSVSRASRASSFIASRGARGLVVDGGSLGGLKFVVDREKMGVCEGQADHASQLLIAALSGIHF